MYITHNDFYDFLIIFQNLSEMLFSFLYSVDYFISNLYSMTSIFKKFKKINYKNKNKNNSGFEFKLFIV